MEFGGLDEELNQIRIGAILRAPARLLPRLDAARRRARYTPRSGIRPMTPDGLPIIGRLGDLANAYVSTGHGMQGITLGPGSALALTELVLHDRTRRRSSAPFSRSSRFSQPAAIHHAERPSHAA